MSPRIARRTFVARTTVAAMFELPCLLASPAEHAGIRRRQGRSVHHLLKSDHASSATDYSERRSLLTTENGAKGWITAARDSREPDQVRNGKNIHSMLRGFSR